MTVMTVMTVMVVPMMAGIATPMTVVVVMMMLVMMVVSVGGSGHGEAEDGDACRDQCRSCLHGIGLLMYLFGQLELRRNGRAIAAQ